ncbi:MAG: glycerol-3-phosphate acyltransferase, partial [Gemmatimonadota bacterium]
VATAGGIFAAVAPLAFLAGLGVFVVTVAVTRYVSLGSLMAALALPIAVAATQGWRSPGMLAALAVTAFVSWSHRGNIARLRKGEERRLGRPGGVGREGKSGTKLQEHGAEP